MKAIRPFAITIALVAVSCSSPDPSLESEKKAILFLVERGHDVSLEDGRVKIVVLPETDSQDVTVEDVEAINRISGVSEIRIIARSGIHPDVMAKLRICPSVRKLAIHYQMPAESLKYFDRFPNVEKILFWGDDCVSCEHLPALKKLRILRLESSKGETSPESVKRIAACQNLEEIRIVVPVSNNQIELLKGMPKLRKLEVGDLKWSRSADLGEWRR